MTSRLIPARLLGPRVAPPRYLGGSSAPSGGPVVLVDTPTRVTTMRRVGKTGDTVVITDTLTGYDGTPQDLTGATVVFNLTGPNGTLLINRLAVTIRQSGSTNVGRVTVTIPATSSIPAGLSTWEFEASWDSGATVLTFPDNDHGTLIVINQLG